MYENEEGTSSQQGSDWLCWTPDFPKWWLWAIRKRSNVIANPSLSSLIKEHVMALIAMQVCEFKQRDITTEVTKKHKHHQVV